MEECRRLEFSCESGHVKAILCPPGVDIRGASGVRLEKFTSITIGALASSYDEDWSNAYYLYIAPSSGGFYLEGSLDAFDDPDCGGRVVPRLIGELKRLGVELPPLIEIILSRKVFRSPYPGF